jgi:hypothetical protein
MSSASSIRRTHHNRRDPAGFSLECGMRKLVRLPWLVAVLFLAG